MLTQYSFTLSNKDGILPEVSWGYRFYAELLRQSVSSYTEKIHDDPSSPVPISQYLTVSSEGAQWYVSLLGQECEETLSPVLDDLRQIHIDRAQADFSVSLREIRQIQTLDELFAAGQAVIGLRFASPCAFKSRGEYVNYPSSWLLMQSLVKKWNGCVTECPIEDEDGEGVSALAEGLRFDGYRLQSTKYRLKSGIIPSFTGQIIIDNRLSGFHRELAQALLYVAGFSGAGIKTALGMGGIQSLISNKYDNRR